MRRLAAPLVLALAAAGLVGCDDNAYCFDCGASSSTGGDGDGGGGVGGADAATVTVATSSQGVTVGAGCDADLDTDPLNCGFCGNVCELANAFVECAGGFCEIEECAPGWVDGDNLPANGCEYGCVVSADGVELCDGLDNDCNGLVDEVFDLDVDPLHCGACNEVCSYGNAEGTCDGGECSRGDCFVGFHDVDGDPADCEYACTVTNGGAEACDLSDNDCDGGVDEGIDTDTDPANCGSCGFDCGELFPNATSTCAGGQCAFDACEPGFFDVDGNALNGCEYACTPAAPGAEVCDGEDNDCNGLTDDGALPDVGDPCGPSDVGECAFGVQVCTAGQLACSGAVLPSVEYCDGLDNDCVDGADEACPSAGDADVRLDVGPGSAVGQAVSTQLHAAARGDVVLAAWNDRRSGNADVRASASLDGGLTWLAGDVAVTSTAANEIEPWVALSATRAYVALGRFSGTTRQVVVASAPSPFTTFAPAVRVDGRPAASDSFFPRVVVAREEVGGDDLVVVWQNLSGSGVNVASDVYLQRSLDGGATWLAADRRVNDVDGAAEQPLLATDGDGRVHVIWRDKLTAEVLADVYDVDGNTFGGDQAISNGEPAEHLAVAADPGGDRVVVAWTDLRSAKKGIRLNRSADDGATWAADGVIVNVDSTFADARRPDVVVDAARVFVTWEDTRSGQPDVYVNASTNGGATFRAASSRVDLGTVRGASASFTPRITLGQGEVFVAWRDLRDGQGDIWFNRSFDEGVTFQPLDLRVDVGAVGAPSPPGGADSRGPFVFATDGGERASLVWTDNRTTTGTTGVNGDIYTNVVEAP